jgi:hypothetical protein
MGKRPSLSVQPRLDLRTDVHSRDASPLSWTCKDHLLGRPRLTLRTPVENVSSGDTGAPETKRSMAVLARLFKSRQEEGMSPDETFSTEHPNTPPAPIERNRIGQLTNPVSPNSHTDETIDQQPSQPTSNLTNQPATWLQLAIYAISAVLQDINQVVIGAGALAVCVPSRSRRLDRHDGLRHFHRRQDA